MNAAKAASRMRWRTAVSSPPSWRRFDVDVVAIMLSLTAWYPIVPHFILLISWRELLVFCECFLRRNLFSSWESNPERGTSGYHRMLESHTTGSRSSESGRLVTTAKPGSFVEGC